MPLLAMELNDAGLRAARSESSELLAVDETEQASPGFVWTQRQTLITGAAAARHALVHPTDVHDHYWDALDTQPVDPRRPDSPNRAEVACAHLQQLMVRVLRPDEDLVIAVPPWYATGQLGIIVGIANELDLPLRGLVAAPVAIESPAGTNGENVMVVNMALHRCLVAVVSHEGRVKLGRTRICPDAGLAALRQRWVGAIADEFVRTTRFDPRHSAATEQRLHDLVPEILAALGEHGALPVEVEGADVSHRVTVTEAMLAEAGQPLVFSLIAEVEAAHAEDPVSSILLSSDAARVPGLASVLRRRLAVQVEPLEAGAAALGLTRLWPDRFDQSDDPGVAYHTARS
jgi:hypothetical protein